MSAHTHPIEGTVHGTFEAKLVPFDGSPRRIEICWEGGIVLGSYAAERLLAYPYTPFASITHLNINEPLVSDEQLASFTEWLRILCVSPVAMPVRGRRSPLADSQPGRRR